ncbi:MAG: hypothetical protein J0H82_06705 [Alphaproteobacteria bacterium]|jgi:hypothetical protein|nr:hypothetical protein [Alphaproteobacteria bacterium]
MWLRSRGRGTIRLTGSPRGVWQLGQALSGKSQYARAEAVAGLGQRIGP